MKEINASLDNYLPIDGTALNSSKLNGCLPSTGAGNANTIVQRDGNGYIQNTYFRQTSNENETPTTSSNVIYCNSDGYFRKSSLANIRTMMDLNFPVYSVNCPSGALAVSAGAWTAVATITGIPAGRYFGICYMDAAHFTSGYLRLSKYNSIDTIYLNLPYGNLIMGTFSLSETTSMQLATYLGTEKTLMANCCGIRLIRID